MRPAAMDGVLSPPPRPLTFQASGGPSFGHSLSRPVSLELAVRSGPCHCGQSNCPPRAAYANATRVRANAMVRPRGGNTAILIVFMPPKIISTKILSLAEHVNLLAKHLTQHHTLH